MVLLRRAERAGFALSAAIAACALAACVEPRDRQSGQGMHVSGWDDPKSDAFHAVWLRDQRKKGHELTEIANCTKCHGEDYQGGAVGVSCATKGCHTEPGGPEHCTTCHGTDRGPMPASGEHKRHEPFCAYCHEVPDRLDAKNHVNRVKDIVFSGPALLGGSKPTWDPAERRCSDVYCHGSASPTWQSPAQGDTPCTFCHEAPPSTHVRWIRVATPTSCATCHPAPSEPTIAASHIDGQKQVSEIACDTCHGKDGNPAPAPALDGSTDPSSPRVGAHQRHLLETLPDRIGRVVPCSGCHVVPASVEAPGHLDESAPADVVLASGGSYDPALQTCSAGCHFDKSPPWTGTIDRSSHETACVACHGFPPKTLRDGTVHTYAPPKLDACLACHPYDPATTHVDGLVELLQ